MSHNKVKLSDIIRDFIITSDGDDYANNVSDSALRNFALRGIREIGFDLGKKIKSLKLSVNSSNNTVSLPDDYVDMVKLGVVGGDGIVYVFGQNKNLNMSRRLQTSTDDKVDDSGKYGGTLPAGVTDERIKGSLTDVFDGSPMNIADNSVGDRIDDKTATAGAGINQDAGDRDFYIFENYLYDGGFGRLYGVGGGHLHGEYRINLDQNRIEIDTNTAYTEVVMEYVADEARSGDPEVHVYVEEALRSYIYYKIIERKSSVPMGEKQRARSEYYNERRKANARLSGFTKEEALKTIRKNFKQAPKY
jgi:hypothetical protein|tara:strand:+ start:3741 stop:4655 length:915 start_codon:yes stop_codon:yes gene_type:complete